jgi:hypothetical protein
MRYMGVLAILVSLVLLTRSATANVLSPGDYENFRNLDLKMLSIGDDDDRIDTPRAAPLAQLAIPCGIHLHLYIDRRHRQHRLVAVA